jgi:hypothetical protein
MQAKTEWLTPINFSVFYRFPVQDCAKRHVALFYGLALAMLAKEFAYFQHCRNFHQLDSKLGVCVCLA